MILNKVSSISTRVLRYKQSKFYIEINCYTDQINSDKKLHFVAYLYHSDAMIKELILESYERKTGDFVQLLLKKLNTDCICFSDYYEKYLWSKKSINARK